jgi:hypothetical protein
MAFHMNLGAMMQCSFGAAPASLVVLPQNQVLTVGVPGANIMDNKPMVNIPPFGVCSSMANPAVLAATIAAQGVLTPMPCVPVIPGPWVPGAPTVLLAEMPALDNNSKLMCAWGGLIQINPAQTTVMVP